MASNYTAKVGGSLVNVIAGSLNATAQIGQRSTGSIGVWTAPGVTYQYGTQVQVYDDTGALVYAGYTVKDKVTKQGAILGTGYLEHAITLMDNCYKADKRVIFGSYLLQSAGSIVQDIVNRVLSQEGVTYTASSIASGTTIQEAIWNGKRCSDAIQWLATQCGYWWQIDTSGVMHFSPYGGVPAPFVLDGTQVDATHNLSVEYGNDMYVNTQYTKGAYAEKGSRQNKLHETMHGDSNHPRTFTLGYPVSTLYQLLVNGVDDTTNALSKGQNGGHWYYARGDPVIAQDPSQTALTPSDTLDVYYTGRVPVVALAKNPALITAQATREGGSGSGIVESTYVNTKVHTLPAAQQIASALLSHYGSDTTLLEFDTRSKGLMPGQMLVVQLSDFGLSNKQMLIQTVAISDQVDDFNVWFHVQAVGSPYEAAQFQTYWQALMNQSADPTDLTDVTENAFALLLDSVFSHSPSWAASTITKVTCPICANATLCGNATIIC